MTSRRLAQLCAVALVALTFWAVVSRPGVVGEVFVGAIYAMFFVVTLVVFGVAFFALRLATGGSATYWRMKGADQVAPIGWMILTVLGTMQVARAILHWLGKADPVTAEITYLLAGALVPAAFLQLRLITWPARTDNPGWLRLLLFGGFGLCLAGAWSYAAYSSAADRLDFPPLHELIVSVGAVILGATIEEVLFRVLLLTALLDRTGSRFQAVFLSSVAFGLMHVPGVFLDPVLYGDWPLLQHVAFEYAPEFLLQTFLGLLLGVLWLRTGSITIIALTHAILNMAKVLAYGLLGYS